MLMSDAAIARKASNCSNSTFVAMAFAIAAAGARGTYVLGGS